MSPVPELEKAVLSLPAAEREHLALAAWESLESEPHIVADRTIDPDGILVAEERAEDIESGRVTTIPRSEFLQRTRGVV
jgi:lactam utilization protein B